jgi:hypothetical protein
LTVIEKYEPPLTVASLATINTSRLADASDACDDASRTELRCCTGHGCCQRGEFEERRTRVEQTFDAFAHEEFALLFVAFAILLAATFADMRKVFL